MPPARSGRRMLAHIAASLAPAAATTETDTSHTRLAPDEMLLDPALLEPRPEAEDAEPLPLTNAQVETFLEEGYCLLPGIIDDDLNARICAEHDREAADRGGDAKRQIVSYPELGKLCSLPMIMEKVKQLMGAYGNGETECAMHHIHANRQLPGTGSANWHQVRSHAVVQSPADV